MTEVILFALIGITALVSAYQIDVINAEIQEIREELQRLENK